MSLRKINPYPHQIAAIDACVKYFDDKTKSRGKIIMPCGSGKSLTSYWIIDKMGSSKVLITVPNLILQNQMLNGYYPHFHQKYKFICIGSDEEVSNQENVSVSTDIKEITRFLTHNNSNVIVIATYQSVDVLSKACLNARYGFDVGIIDEAHRTVGLESKPFAKVLFDDNIEIQKRIFFTATEKIYIGETDAVVEMSNPSYYGESIFNYPLAKAIQDKALCDYKVVSIYTTSQEVIDFVQSNSYMDYEGLDLTNSDKEQLLCALMATLKAIKERGCKKIISYHSTIDKAQIFKRLLQQVILHDNLNINVYHVNGNQTNKERFENIWAFESGNISVLTNSKALVEGVDIPCVDGILFVDKKQNTIEIIQAVGRSLRNFNGKKLSHIIIPVLTSEMDMDIKRSNFSGMFNILIALCITDEHFFNKLTSQRVDGQSTVAGKSAFEQTFEIGKELKEQIASMTERIKILIHKKLYGFLKFEEAREYVQKHLVPEGLNSNRKWHKYAPYFIPLAPDKYYKEWISWHDWLWGGSKFLSYKEAKKWVRENHPQVNSNAKWDEIKSVLPAFIPKNPDAHYIRLGDWIDWNNFISIYYTYEEAKNWVRENTATLGGISTSKQWYKSDNIPDFIPKVADAYYKKRGEWVSWDDWFGRTTGFLSYEDAKKWVRENHPQVNSTVKWNEIKSELPAFIPKAPNTVYADSGWDRWSVFLGTNTPKQLRYENGDFWEYKEAKKWVKENLIPKGIVSITEYRKADLPTFIPRAPDCVYEKHNRGWKGYDDYFGRTTTEYLPYDEAKQWVQENLVPKGIDNYKKLMKAKSSLPPFITPYPYHIYKEKGWINAEDFFGKKTSFLSYEEAKKWVQENLIPKGINTYDTWRENISALPKFIPRAPNSVYKEWKGFGHFLGMR